MNGSGRLFDDNLYRFDTPQPSYWEATRGTQEVDAARLQSDESCDVAVIGAGYTGLSAALHLARDYGLDVRVLDAGTIGWGASGRNAGFCCPGGTVGGAGGLVRRAGFAAARDYYRAQCEAVELVRGLATEEGIDCRPVGSAEVEVAHTPRAFGSLRREYAALRSLGMRATLIEPGAFRERYFDAGEQHGALVSKPAFGLHPLQFCLGLAAAAGRNGAKLHARSEVVEWSTVDSGHHRLVTCGGTLRARRVIFATNGFMPESLRPAFAGRTLPAISAIVVTRPLREDERRAQHWASDDLFVNSRRVLNYFRLLPDGRFLFGGRGGPDGSAAGAEQAFAELTRTFRRIWPAWQDVSVEFRWHGLICMTASAAPCIGRLDDDESVYFGFGYRGNGVNNATWAGRQLADWIGRGTAPGTLPNVMRGLGRRFPLPGLRRSYLRFALGVARQLDRF